MWVYLSILKCIDSLIDLVVSVNIDHEIAGCIPGASTIRSGTESTQPREENVIAN